MNEEITKTTANKIGKAFDSIIDPLHQRISNPFIASFLISWVIINWKSIVFLIFSSQSIENKFEVISHSFYGNEWYGTKNILLYFIFPLVISFLYLILLPRLENIFDDLNKGPKIKKSDTIKDINLKTLENRKAYAEKQAVIENIRADYLNVQGLNQKIGTLNTELEIRNATIEKNESQIRNQGIEIGELSLNLERINKENNELKTENEKSIKRLQDELNEKSKGMNSKDLEIANLKRSLSEYQNDLKVLREDLEGSQRSLQILNEEYKNQTKILTEKDETINELLMEKTSLEDANYQLNAEINTLKINLNQFSDFELHIPEFPEAMRKISERFPELPVENYQYFNGQPMPEIVNVISRFMIDLKKIVETTPKISPNYYVRIRKGETISDVEAINFLFKESKNFQIYILGFNIDNEGNYHININSKNEIYVHDLFGFGPEIWQMNTLELLIDSQQ